MRSAHITRRQAEALTDGLDTDDTDVSAVQEEVPMRFEREELRRKAEVDQLLQDVEHKLVTAHKIATGQQQYGTARRLAGVQQARRRSDKVALRRLPTRASDFADIDGEAA